jgi:hypothetical protein
MSAHKTSDHVRSVPAGEFRGITRGITELRGHNTELPVKALQPSYTVRRALGNRAKLTEEIDLPSDAGNGINLVPNQVLKGARL